MASEAAMNHAGRTSSHPFQDLRSAARAKQRTRKHNPKYSHYRNCSHDEARRLCCCSDSYPQPCTSELEGHYLRAFPAEHDDLSLPCTKTPLRGAKRKAYDKAHYSLPYINHPWERPRKHSYKWACQGLRKKIDAQKEADSGEWEGDLFAERSMDRWIEEMNGLERYWAFGQLREVFESWDDWTEYGETFEKFCQRRIREMREAKETRLQAELDIQPSTLSVDVDEDEGYSSDVSSPSPVRTTMATSPSDIRAEQRIKRILTPFQRWIKYPTIRGHWWFDEYTWYWHRNWSGCWILERWDCDEVNRHWRFCYCHLFGKDEPAPEEQQTSSLVEWVGEKSWKEMLLLDEEWDRNAAERAGATQSQSTTREVENAQGKGTAEDVEDAQSQDADDESWDVISTTSEAWVEVDGSEWDMIEIRRSAKH